MVQRIILAGNTGLIGSAIQAQLEKDPTVICTGLARKELPPKNVYVDYEKLCGDPEAVLRAVLPYRADVAICCLGTTIRTAGSQAAMYRVDHDYVLALAQAAKFTGVRQFILVTAAGSGGPGFYLKTKGIVEQDVKALGFERLDIVHPGLLLGTRSTPRPVEAFAQRVWSALTPFLIRSFQPYGAISASVVADAIVALIGEKESGCNVHDNTRLAFLASRKRIISKVEKN